MQTLCSSGVFSSKWCPWLVQNLCSSGSFFFKNGALSWCKIVLIWSFFLQIVLLAGANLCSSVAFLVLFWCSVMVPSLCIWFNISFSGKKWCSWLVQNLRSSGAFFFNMVLLAGAKCVLIWHFFLQDGAPGWCTILCSSGVFSSKLCSWLLHSSGVFSSKWFSWLVRNLCPSDSFFLQNGAPS